MCSLFCLWLCWSCVLVITYTIISCYYFWFKCDCVVHVLLFSHAQSYLIIMYYSWVKDVLNESRFGRRVYCFVWETTFQVSNKNLNTGNRVLPRYRIFLNNKKRFLTEFFSSHFFLHDLAASCQGNFWKLAHEILVNFFFEIMFFT